MITWKRRIISWGIEVLIIVAIFFWIVMHNPQGLADAIQWLIPVVFVVLFFEFAMYQVNKSRENFKKK
jgi:FtsH-binding integral membrane protein